MPRVEGPLLSFQALGMFGGEVVFDRFNKRNYARRAPRKVNPNTAPQQKVRGVFSKLGQMFRVSGPLAREPWFVRAKEQKKNPFNPYVAVNIPRLKAQVEMSNFQGSPEPSDAPRPPFILAAWNAGTNLLDVFMADPIFPAGWSLIEAVVIFFQNQTPDSPFIGTIPEAEKAASPFVFALDKSGLSGQVIVQGWFKWQEPGGKFSYCRKRGTLATLP